MLQCCNCNNATSENVAMSGKKGKSRWGKRGKVDGSGQESIWFNLYNYVIYNKLVYDLWFNKAWGFFAIRLRSGHRSTATMLHFLLQHCLVMLIFFVPL